ncbi:MAG: hypothetical protein ABIY90_18470 [Puia sp.]
MTKRFWIKESTLDALFDGTHVFEILVFIKSDCCVNEGFMHAPYRRI